MAKTRAKKPRAARQKVLSGGRKRVIGLVVGDEYFAIREFEEE